MVSIAKGLQIEKSEPFLKNTVFNQSQKKSINISILETTQA